MINLETKYTLTINNQTIEVTETDLVELHRVIENQFSILTAQYTIMSPDRYLTTPTSSGVNLHEVKYF